MNIYIDDKKSSIEEVCKVLGIDLKQIPKSKKVKKFERLGVRDEYGNYKLDPQTKRPVIPSGLVLKTSFNAKSLARDSFGARYKITVSNNQSTKSLVGGNTQLTYDEPFIEIPSAELLVDADDFVRFFYLYINHRNEGSPLNVGIDNPDCSYRYFDEEAAAKKINTKEDAYVDAMVKLRNLGETELRILAKGYKVSHEVDNLEIEVVKSLLVTKIKENPIAFLNDLNDDLVAFRGVIKDAIDKKILVSRVSTNGTMWSFDGVDLVEINSTISNPIDSLVSVVNAQIDELFPRLMKAIENHNAQRTLTSSVSNRAVHFSAFKGDAPKAGEAVQTPVNIIQQNIETVQTPVVVEKTDKDSENLSNENQQSSAATTNVDTAAGNKMHIPEEVKAKLMENINVKLDSEEYTKLHWQKRKIIEDNKEAFLYLQSNQPQ